MNMFEEIEREKKKMPKVDTLTKEFIDYDYNFYQILSFVVFGFGVVLGIIFGACGSTTSFYSDFTLTTEFNISLMLFSWLVSFLISVFIFGMGHIIAILSDINKKMK